MTDSEKAQAQYDYLMATAGKMPPTSAKFRLEELALYSNSEELARMYDERMRKDA